tara:strand:+ start:13036 stop:13587 length:552 start_codon:yes stop_codon:yes gene_type:complete
MAKEITIHPDNTARSKFTALKQFMLDALAGGPISVLVRRPSRSREQEKLYHKLIAVISDQVTFETKHPDSDPGRIVYFFGRNRRRKYKPEIWKALLVDQFEQERALAGEPLRKPGQIVPAMDGSGRMVTVRPSTTGFSVAEGSDFIEFIFAQGIELGVKWPATAEEIAAAERDWIASNRGEAA